jgi:hypothetical protein
MTLRTGKGGRYRYYACSIKARHGETGCKGRSCRRTALMQGRGRGNVAAEWALRRSLCWADDP